MSEIELRTCPFCGEDAVLRFPNSIGAGGNDFSYVQCTYCDAMTKGSEDEYTSKENWNMRED